MGSSVAFLQFPAFAILSQYFDKRRAAAMGLAVSGSSIGGIIFPIVLSKFLNDSNLSFGWSIRIVAFIMVPFMLFACFIISPRVPPRGSTLFIGAAWKNKKYVLLVVSLFFMMMGMWTPVFYIPVYAVSRGMKPLLASYLLSIINGSSTFGRIIPGILAAEYVRFRRSGHRSYGLPYQRAYHQRGHHRLLSLLRFRVWHDYYGSQCSD
jgi:MFS family permease